MEYKKVLITGAGGDLGAALCRRFAQAGSAIVAVNRSQAPVQALQAELGDSVDFSSYFVDLSDLEALDKLVPTILAEHPDIDLVLLNAGIDVPQKLTDPDWRLAKQHYDVNVISSYVILSHVAPLFLQRDTGRIAIVSSLASYAGFPYEHAYNGSKAGARMLIDGIRAELGQTNVKVSGIYPGFLEGRMAASNAWAVDSVVSLVDAAETVFQGLAEGKAEIRFPEELVQLINQVNGMTAEERDALSSSMMKHD